VQWWDLTTNAYMMLVEVVARLAQLFAGYARRLLYGIWHGYCCCLESKVVITEVGLDSVGALIYAM
jgi:hypothetical protein